MLRQLQLWDEAQVEQDWSVRESARARRLSVRVFRSGSVEIVVPPRTSPKHVSAFVSEHREWIERQRRRSATPSDWPMPPPQLSLTALGEQWRCTRIDDGTRTRVLQLPDFQLQLYGAARDPERLRQLLRRWLIERAQHRFEAPLRTLAAQLQFAPRRLQVRCQRTRWGSCSRTGTISLNACLLFQTPEVLRYLMVHELSHLRHMNHSERFWAEVERHEPDWKRLDRELLQGWRRVPAWMIAR